MEKAHSITPASREDVQQIADINNHVIEYYTANFDWYAHPLAYYEEWFRNKQENNYPVLVAKHGDEVLGFASYGQFRGKLGYLHCMEHSVYVKKGNQGKGIGSALLRAIIEEAKRNEVHVLVAGIDSSNEESIRFHERFDFQKTGEMKEVGKKFDRWLDLTFLQLILNK